MKKFMFIRMLLTAVLSLATGSALAGEKEEKERAQNAANAFREILSAPDAQAVPQELLNRCECVAMFPSVKKGGFIVGGQYGRGLISCRRDAPTADRSASSRLRARPRASWRLARLAHATSSTAATAPINAR